MYVKAFAYLIVVLGCTLAFAAAVVPHYTAGYRLLAGVFIASVIPYIVYGALTEILRDSALLIVGILIFAIDLSLKLPPRFFSSGITDSTVLMYASLALTILPLGALLVTQLPRSQGRKQ